MHQKRRSGRIAKELEIVLLGTDTTGKVFSEPTKTVVLSRHGAGVISRYRFTPDEILSLRLPDSTKEAEVRLVGQIGGEPGRYVYGVAFVDPDPHFWPMEFPPPESIESARPPLVLDCSLCQARQTFEPHEIEEDVYSVNGNILRYCESCGTATPWKKAEVNAPPTSATASRSGLNESSRGDHARKIFTLVSPSPEADARRPSLAARAPLLEPLFGEAQLIASRGGGSPYSGASAVAEFSSLAELQSTPATSSAMALLQPPETSAAPGEQFVDSVATGEEAPVRILDANGKRVNRRKHMRIRVNFNACVRHPEHGDEIVECENVSRGGLCFHSRKQYPAKSVIEIAAPFSPGETALFVPAQIKRVEALSGGQLFRYGIEYRKPSAG